MTTSNPSFPPIDDAVSYVKNINWDELKRRSKRDINRIGLVLAATGEYLHDFGVYLADM